MEVRLRIGLVLLITVILSMTVQADLSDPKWYWKWTDFSMTDQIESLTLTNNGVTVIQGILGNGSYFNANTDYLRYQDVAKSLTRPYAYNVWLKPDAQISNDYVLHTQNTASAGTQTYFNLGASGNRLQYMYGTEKTLLTTPVWVQSEWQMFTIVVDSLNAYLYINGTLFDSTASTIDIATMYFQIGNHRVGTVAYMGAMDEFIFYDHNITKEEVLELWNGGLGFDPTTATPATAPTWKNLTNNATNISILGTEVKFNCTAEDAINLSSFTFETNQTGTNTNSTTVFITGNSTQLQHNLTITAPPLSSVCGRFYFNNTNALTNVTDISCFNVSQSTEKLIFNTMDNKYYLSNQDNNLKLYLNGTIYTTNDVVVFTIPYTESTSTSFKTIMKFDTSTEEAIHRSSASCYYDGGTLSQCLSYMIIGSIQHLTDKVKTEVKYTQEKAIEGDKELRQRIDRLENIVKQIYKGTNKGFEKLENFHNAPNGTLEFDVNLP